MLKDPEYYIKNKLKKKLNWISERNCGEFLEALKHKPFRYYYKIFSPKPNLIADMTWENLIILDGCRFDLFNKCNDIPGTLKKITSAASCTWDWVYYNFSNFDMKDVVYISANPFISYYYLHKRLGRIPFYKIVEVWKDSWNKELETVHPLAINEATLKSLKLYNKKRYIIHYMQPHHPFIGDIKLLDMEAVDFRNIILGNVQRDKNRIDVWDMLRQKKIDPYSIWRAYISNFQLVIKYVKLLLNYLNGKICISSDHGNSFGRYGIFYGHPEGIALPELIHVPWFEVDTDTLSTRAY